MSSKSLRERWARGEPTLGVWCAIPSSVSTEIAARTGADFVCVDMQHGLVGYDDTLQMLQAIDTTPAAPVIRVPWNDPAVIGKALDFGAMTIIVPMTNTAVDAKEAVAACQYAPDGIRSFGPTRVGMREGPDYFPSAKDQVAVLPMIETAEALENVEEIAAVPGISGLFLGPFDLSVSIGLPPGNNDGDPQFDAAIERVVAACRKYSITAGILANAEVGAKRVRQGFGFVAVSMDFMALARAVGNDLNTVRSEIE